MEEITFLINNLRKPKELVNRIQTQLNRLNSLLNELNEFKIQIVLKPNP